MKFVNSYQTPEQRREKYKLLRQKGATWQQAAAWRDWTNGHINRIAIPFLEKISNERQINECTSEQRTTKKDSKISRR